MSQLVRHAAPPEQCSMTATQAFRWKGGRLWYLAHVCFASVQKKPLVIETQRDAYVELDSVVERRPDRPSQPAYLAATSDDDDEVVEQYLEVRNLISGECVHDLHYALYVNGERIIDDETINLGCTVAVKGHCTVAAIMWHEGWAV